MRAHAFLRGIPAAAAVAVSMVCPLGAQTTYGILDGTFLPRLNANQQSLIISSVVPQPDTGILIAGQFEYVADTPTGAFTLQRNVAKFTEGGIFDPTYRPEPGATSDTLPSVVYNTVALPDGSSVYAGVFTIANKGRPTQVTRSKIAKFGPDGTVVPDNFTAGGFLYTNPGGHASITSLSPHTLDEGFVVASDLGMFRIEADGSIDSSFQTYSSPAVSGASVQSTTIQWDDKIILNGAYAVNGAAVDPQSGVNNPYFDRVALNGTLGTPIFTANPGITAATYCSIVQPDNKILVGGTFGTGNGFPIVGIARYNSDGTKDTDFFNIHKFDQGRPFLDGAVRAMALQTDGRILIGGDFVNIRKPVKNASGLWEYEIRRGIARLFPDGSLDASFDAKIEGSNWSVTGIALQRDGRVLITGNFQKVSTSDRPLIARLTNYGATQSLTTDGTNITWLRGGSSPEAKSVVLEYRTPPSTHWVRVSGNPIRIVGGWSRSGITPVIPPNSLVRASALTSGGQFNGSTGIVATTIGFQTARISLQRDTPFAFIPHNGTTNFLNVGVNRPREFAFTLTNGGDAGMTGITTSISGTHASQFSIANPPPSTLAVGGSAPIDISFNPTSIGAKTATLVINSNDPEIPAFTVTLNGTAVTAIEGFRYEYFNTIANTGTAADTQDPDGDGLTNFFEFVAGLNPTDKTSTFEQRVEISAGQAKVIFRPRLSDRTYEVLTGTSLTSGDWTPATGTTTDNSTERTFTDSNPTNGGKRFYRVKITPP